LKNTIFKPFKYNSIESLNFFGNSAHKVMLMLDLECASP